MHVYIYIYIYSYYYDRMIIVVRTHSILLQYSVMNTQKMLFEYRLYQSSLACCTLPGSSNNMLLAFEFGPQYVLFSNNMLRLSD